MDGMPAHQGQNRLWALEDDVNAVVDRAQSKQLKVCQLPHAAHQGRAMRRRARCNHARDLVLSVAIQGRTNRRDARP